MRELRWATLGTGVIARELAAAMKKQGRTLYSVANRTYEKGLAFAEQYGIEKVYREIDEVFADEKVDVLYISTPHNTHMPFVRRALAAKKHVLCEKSITLNSAELDEAMVLAEQNGVVFAEAMTIYHMPLYREINRYLAAHAVGKLSLMTLNFGSFKNYDMQNRFFNRQLAGGALLDIGVYALSLCRWFFSEKPNQLQSQVVFAPTGVDEKAGILLKNDSGEMATVMLSLHTKQPKRASIAYEKGYLEIFEYPRGVKASFTYTEDGRTEEIAAGRAEDALLYEITDMEAAIKNGGTMFRQYSKDVMDMMTALRQSWGLRYPEEE